MLLESTVRVVNVEVACLRVGIVVDTVLAILTIGAIGTISTISTILAILTKCIVLSLSSVLVPVAVGSDSPNVSIGTIGNVVGSNIFNIGIVIGVPIALFGGIGEVAFSYIDSIVMIFAAILMFFFSFNDRKIDKREGIIFLLIFIAYYSYVIL